MTVPDMYMPSACHFDSFLGTHSPPPSIDKSWYLMLPSMTLKVRESGEAFVACKVISPFTLSINVTQDQGPRRNNWHGRNRGTNEWNG